MNEKEKINQNKEKKVKFAFPFSLISKYHPFYTEESKENVCRKDS
jgi:hypothetical protein